MLAAISNTDYEGEINNQGDKVHIRTKPTITIRDYQAGGNLTVDRPASNIVDLIIDKGLYFNEILDDVMEIQSDINLMGIWSDDAAQQMKITVDSRVLLSLLNAATPPTVARPRARSRPTSTSVSRARRSLSSPIRPTRRSPGRSRSCR